jgi:hypothetical protein
MRVAAFSSTDFRERLDSPSNKKLTQLRCDDFVNRIGQMSNHFIEDLKLLAALVA